MDSCIVLLSVSLLFGSGRMESLFFPFFPDFNKRFQERVLMIIGYFVKAVKSKISWRSRTVECLHFKENVKRREKRLIVQLLSMECFPFQLHIFCM